MSDYTKGQGGKIAIKFTEDLVGDVTGNESAFTVAGKEYKYINGELLDKTYQIDSVERYPANVVHEDNFIGGTISGVTVNSQSIKLTDVGASPQVAFIQEWNSNPYTGSGYSTNSITNSIMTVTATNGDPMINMYSLGSFNPNVYKFIEIKYRVVSGTAGYVEIFFTNSRRTSASADQYASASLISDQAWHTVKIDMSSVNYWTYSNITGWRYDFCTASGVKMELDYIRLIDGGGTKYNTTGSYISEPISLSTFPSNPRINWADTLPTNTAIVIETGVNTDSTTTPTEWVTQTNGELISNMPSTNEGYFLWIICILQTTDTTVTPTLTRLWLEEANAPQNQLLITFNYLSRFCTVEGGLTVNYDSSKGNLAGEGGAIESFTKVFIPTELIPEPNPGIQETITVVPYITLDYLAIEYLKTYVKEYLTTSPVTATTALSYNYVEKDAWLQANTQLVKFNASGQLLSESNSIVMTVSTPLFTTPTFTYRVIIGGVEYDNYYTVNGSQITINMVTLLTDHPDFTEATLKMTVVEGALTLYDYVTIYKIQDGSTDVVALLTNEYHTIVAIYDTAGAETRLILDQALCDIKVYQGFNDVTSQYTFTKIDSDSMKSVFYDNRDQLQIIGMPTILTGQVQIVGTHSTLPSVTKTMQLVKSQRGLIVNP